MSYVRKTVDVWEVQGWYCKEYGWECLTTELDSKSAKQILKDYNDNEQAPHRIKRRRIPKEKFEKGDF